MALNVVIAGGGFGGLYAARRLERRLPRHSARITLVTDQNFLLYTPLLPGAASGSLEPRHVVVPLREELDWTDIRLARVTSVDPDAKKLRMNLLDGSHLLGTDCRPQALMRARAARYPLRMLRDVPRAWQEKYFDRDDAFARVRPELRAAVQWRTGDVTRLCEPGTWDLILCRNLTMYLHPHVADRIWNALEDALRPGGFLVLGKAERPVGAQRLGSIAPCIYRKDRV